MQGAVLGVPSKEEARVLLRILAAFALGAKWSDDRPVFFSVGEFSKALMMHVYVVAVRPCLSNFKHPTYVLGGG